LPPQRALQLSDLALQLPQAGTLLLAGERLQAALEQLLPPRVIERLRDPMLAAALAHRPIAAQPGQHDLRLLLRRPAPVLPLLAQPCSPCRSSGPSRASRRTIPPGLRPSGIARRTYTLRLSTRDRGSGHRSWFPSPTDAQPVMVPLTTRPD